MAKKTSAARKGPGRKKTARKTTTRKTTRRKAAPSKTAAPTLEAMSSGELAAELRRRQSGAARLIKKRDRLREQLAEIEAEIAGMDPGLTVPGGGKRHRNESNLVDALAGVLDGVEMTVTDLSEAVQRAGYQTTSPNFRTIVNQALIKNTKVFKRVSRGVYTAK